MISRRIDHDVTTITMYPTRERAERAIQMMLEDDQDYGAEVIQTGLNGQTKYAIRVYSLIDGAELAIL